MSCPFKVMKEEVAALRSGKAETNATSNGSPERLERDNSNTRKVKFAPDVPVLDKNDIRKFGAYPTCYTVLEDGPVLKVRESATSDPSNCRSGEGSPRTRKTSNISVASSIGSEGDSTELTSERKVDLNFLIEGVGALIIPLVSTFFIVFN